MSEHGQVVDDGLGLLVGHAEHDVEYAVAEVLVVEELDQLVQVFNDQLCGTNKKYI